MLWPAGTTLLCSSGPDDRACLGSCCPRATAAGGAHALCQAGRNEDNSSKSRKCAECTPSSGVGPSPRALGPSLPPGVPGRCCCGVQRLQCFISGEAPAPTPHSLASTGHEPFGVAPASGSWSAVPVPLASLGPGGGDRSVSGWHPAARCPVRPLLPPALLKLY